MKNTEENYPQKMLRGISSFDFIKDGILLDQAFDLDPAREDGYKLRRKTHTLACGMKAAFSVQNYISTT